MKEKDRSTGKHPTDSSSVPPEVIAAAQRLPQTDWRHFPQFEQSLATAETTKEMLAKIEKTCRQLEVFRKNGTVREKARAQSAMRAYGRALELIRKLDDLRSQPQEAQPK